MNTSTLDSLCQLFDDPSKARIVIMKLLSPDHISHLQKTADEILENLGRILQSAARRKTPLKCALLENELAALTELKSHGRGGWQYEKSFSAIEDWAESFDDRDPDDWENHYDPGHGVTGGRGE